jgi:signal transduction histidine kinase
MQAAETEDLRTTLRSQAGELAEARRVRAVAESVAGVAHDFNNLLTIMVGAAELIATEPDASEEIVELARRIVSVGFRGEALGRSLIEFAEPSPPVSRVVRPAEIVAGQLELLQAAAGDRHLVQLEVRSTAGRVLIDPHQLERVLLNLVVNARDAMPDGGTIRVIVDNGSNADSGDSLGEFVVVAVADEGSGIEPEVLSRIFDPFFSTKPRGQGTGVGLAVVRQVVDYSGGFVCVDTGLGKGTTFRVYLPRASCF